MRDLGSLPKAHLHVHLEPTMRPSTLDELAAELGLSVPPVGRFTDFPSFVVEYLSLLSVLSTPANVGRLVDEAVEDAARDGAWAIELATTPPWYEAVFGSLDAAVAGLSDACVAAGERHGVWVGLVVAIQRDLDDAHALACAEVAVRHAGRGVVALGLHGEERGFPAGGFERPFAMAREAGLLAVPHAGELVGPASVWQAIEVLRADRVQHGVTSVGDERLLGELAARGVCLDVCPSSNVQLGVVPDIESHPLPTLLSAGVRCSINADDPVLFGCGLLDEYELARRDLGLSDDVLASCAASSIRASAAPTVVKERALAGVEAWRGDGA